MESFPKANKIEDKNNTEKSPFLERFRKAGVWIKGGIAGLAMAGAIESSATSGVDPRAGRNLEEGENLKMSLFLENPFKSASFEISNEDKKELEGEIKGFFEGMTKQEAVEFANNPNIIFQIKSSSDETPFATGAEIKSEKYGSIKSNESLAEARAREAGDLFVSLLSEIDNPNLNQDEDSMFQEALNRKIVEYKTPPRGITTKDKIKEMYGDRKLTDKEALDLARYIGFEVIEKSGKSANKEIAEDFSQYIYYHLLVDQSASMVDNLEEIMSNLPEDASFANHITYQGFAETLEGESIDIKNVADLNNKVKDLKSNIEKNPNSSIEINEQSMMALLEVLEDIPDSKNTSEKHCLRVITDEHLRDIRLEDLTRIKELSQDKNVDVKITIYDNLAKAFRTVTPGQLEDIIVSDSNLSHDEKVRFNINGGRFFVENMPRENNFMALR